MDLLLYVLEQILVIACCWTDKVAIESARQRQQKLDQKINQECENILNNHLK
jgi:hypothetical protein